MVHNSHMPFYRTPQNAVPCGTMVTFRFLSDEADRVMLRVWNGGEHFIPMSFDGQVTYEATFTVPSTPTVVWYEFLITTHSGQVCYGNAPDLLGGEGSVQGYDHHSFQITVYDPSYQTPDYMHGANIYQIFPDRFHKAFSKAKCLRSDRYIHEKWEETPILIGDPITRDNTATDFYGGTLTGIADKLPYLKSLGITVIYLNPIFESQSNHRYNTGDYKKIDPLLGTNNEFSALCEKAKEIGIHIMLDGVFSHTGSDSIYFNKEGHYASIGAFQSKESPYYEWYQFMDYPHLYKSWWGFQTLPEVNKKNASFNRFMFDCRNGIVPSWIKKGACGWRLDVADELPMDFLRKLRLAAKKASPHAVVLGEVWEDASNKVAYGETRCYCLGDTLDSVMNYPLRDAIISFLRHDCNAYSLARLIRHQQEVYPTPFLYSLMNLIGSHDRARAINTLVNKTYENLPVEKRGEQRLSKDEYLLGKKRLMKAYSLLCALPGAPTIYYGDEVGVQGGPDPFCRSTFPWGNEDAELLSFVKEQLNLRLQTPVLLTGKMNIEAVDDDTIVITRFFDGEDAFGHKKEEQQRIYHVSRKG